MIIEDKELDKSFIYFLCAYYFHWTPEQVDKTDAYMIDTLLTVLPLWKKKESEVKEHD